MSDDEITNEWLLKVANEVGWWHYERHFAFPDTGISVRAYAREGGRWEYSLFVGDVHVQKKQPKRSDLLLLFAAMGLPDPTPK